jgi:hypothetical protein
MGKRKGGYTQWGLDFGSWNNLNADIQPFSMAVTNNQVPSWNTSDGNWWSISGVGPDGFCYSYSDGTPSRCDPANLDHSARQALEQDFMPGYATWQWKDDYQWAFADDTVAPSKKCVAAMTAYTQDATQGAKAVKECYKATGGNNNSNLDPSQYQAPTNTVDASIVAWIASDPGTYKGLGIAPPTGETFVPNGPDCQNSIQALIGQWNSWNVQRQSGVANLPTWQQVSLSKVGPYISDCFTVPSTGGNKPPPSSHWWDNTNVKYAAIGIGVIGGAFLIAKVARA